MLSEEARALVRLRCHRCRSADLVLYESHIEHAEFDGGLFVNARGRLEAAGAAVFSAGEIQPQMTRVKCESCGHEWHPRRWFDGITLAADEAEGHGHGAMPRWQKTRKGAAS